MQNKRGRPPFPICPQCSRKFKRGQGLAAHLRHMHPDPEVIERAKPNGHGPLAGLLAETDKRIAKMQHLRSRIVAVEEAMNELGT